jgi:transposase
MLERVLKPLLAGEMRLKRTCPWPEDFLGGITTLEEGAWTCRGTISADVSDSQWAQILPLLPAAKSGPSKPGRLARDLRLMLDGIPYLNKTGCQWRLLPDTFGLLSSVCGYSYRWCRANVWKNGTNALRAGGRKRQGCPPNPRQVASIARV